MESEKYLKTIFYSLVFLCVVVAGFLMKTMSTFAVPLVVSILLSCVFYPIVRKLHEKLKFPWLLGTLLMILVIVIILLLLSTVLGASLNAFLDQYSKYEKKFLTLYKLFADTFNLQFYDDKSFIENLWGQLKVREFVQKFAISASGNIISFTKTFGLILLFVVFLLIEMQKGHEKVNFMFKDKDSNRVMNITRKIVAETVRFLSIKFFISLATAFLVYVCCLIVGIDFAILWAFLSFVMNFIPTFGSIFSVLITTIFALIQYFPSSPVRIFFILIATTSVNMVLGNIVEPRVEGKNLGISPFVILVSLTLWGWMWGFVGMIIAVPLMVIVKIICENVSFLHPIAILLGNKPSDTEKELSK